MGCGHSAVQHKAITIKASKRQAGNHDDDSADGIPVSPQSPQSPHSLASPHSVSHKQSPSFPNHNGSIVSKQGGVKEPSICKTAAEPTASVCNAEENEAVKEWLTGIEIRSVPLDHDTTYPDS